MKLNRKRVTLSAVSVAMLAAVGGSVAVAASNTSQQPAPVTAASLPSNLLAAYPMLRKAQTVSEASQTPAVTAALQRFNKSESLGGEAAPASEVNSELARRYYSRGSKAAFLVPGTKGTVCSIEVGGANGASGGGCTTTESLVEKGIVGWAQLDGESMEIAGLLPSGTSAVTVVTATGTEEVTLNESGGFGVVTATPPISYSYTLPNGRVVKQPVLVPNHSTGRLESAE